MGVGPYARLHRQYRHAQRPGVVRIADNAPDTLHPKTGASVAK
jgi:hypothetical protein